MMAAVQDEVIVMKIIQLREGSFHLKFGSPAMSCQLRFVNPVRIFVPIALNAGLPLGFGGSGALGAALAAPSCFGGSAIAQGAETEVRWFT
jgi:hypothetical protein